MLVAVAGGSLLVTVLVILAIIAIIVWLAGGFRR